MQIEVLNGENGEKVSFLECSDDFFGRKYNPTLVQQVVRVYMANGRQGTRAQKNRGEVNYSTKKPWRQKGTGRARAGMRSSPIWRGGGLAFPSRADENFSQKINRKMYRIAMSAIFSQLLRDNRLFILDDLSSESNKTRDFVAKLKKLSVTENALFIIPKVQENLYLSSRNLKGVELIEVNQSNPVALLKYAKTFLTVDAARQIEEQWRVK